MENARNSFYLTLRNQLAIVNPLRVTVVRGIQRPGILVEENESASAMAAADIFALRWADCSVDTQHALPLSSQVCEFLYWTEGTSTSGGLDRGRLLSLMDADLLQILNARSGAKQNWSMTPPTLLSSRIFWTSPVFAPIVTTQNRLSRMARVTLYSYEEAADL